MRKREKPKKKVSLSLKLLYLLLISLIIISFSMSRFKTTYEGGISADTALWTFNITGSQNQTFTINLGDTVDISDNFSYIRKVIAPGASGSFTIAIDCTGSDVAIDYEVVLKTNDNSEMPEEIIFYEINDTTKTTLVNVKDSDGNFSNNLKSLEGSRSLAEIEEQPIQYITINWLWQINTDINESRFEGQNVYIDISVTGKQQV